MHLFHQTALIETYYSLCCCTNFNALYSCIGNQSKDFIILVTTYVFPVKKKKKNLICHQHSQFWSTFIYLHIVSTVPHPYLDPISVRSPIENFEVLPAVMTMNWKMSPFQKSNQYFPKLSSSCSSSLVLLINWKWQYRGGLSSEAWF